MAKLGGLIRVEVDKDGELFYRQPTTEEWNIFRDKSTEALTDNDYKAEMQAYADFHDLLFDHATCLVVEVDGKDVELTKETQSAMPDRNKYSCVNAAFVNYRIFIPKNL